MTTFNIEQYNISISIDESYMANEDNEKNQLQLTPDINNENSTTSNVASNKKLKSLKIEKNEISFREWLIENFSFQKDTNSTRIAIIEEIAEVRSVTYGELYNDMQRTAHYMSHHGIKSGDRVLLCLNNSVEHVLYLLGAIFLNAVPVLVKPNHVASDKLKDIGCSSAIVDFENYEDILLVSQYSLKNVEKVFVLADDIAEIQIPRHVIVIDGFGFLEFTSNFEFDKHTPSNTAFIIPGSQNEYQYVIHTQKSGYILCNEYFSKLSLFSDEINESNKSSRTHLITNNIYSFDSLSYIFYNISHGETCILSESTQEIWKESFLDRIADLIDRYCITILIANSQLIKSFIKYDVNEIYNLKSLKVVSNHGAVISESVATKFIKKLNVILLQAYCSAEFGVASFGFLEESDEGHFTHCGAPFGDIKIKIAHLDTDKEIAYGEWGQIILSGNKLFSKYAEESFSQSSKQSWFKTGDYGMIDKKNRLFFEGRIKDLVQVHGKQKVSSERIECVLSQHRLIEDIVVMQDNNALCCGLLLKNLENCPTTESLERFLKKNNIFLAIHKIFILDFIPRSDDGKILRNEVAFQMKTEIGQILESNTESYI